MVLIIYINEKTLLNEIAWKQYISPPDTTKKIDYQYNSIKNYYIDIKVNSFQQDSSRYIRKKSFLEAKINNKAEKHPINLCV